MFKDTIVGECNWRVITWKHYLLPYVVENIARCLGLKVLDGSISEHSDETINQANRPM